MTKKTQRSLNFPDMDSSSLTATTTQLELLDAPTVYYTPEAWETMWYVINKCEKEVGWLGLVEQDEEDNSYLITEIFIPEQLVHGAETDITAETLGKLANYLEIKGKDSSQLRYWGHSHVNMGVSPSMPDELQVDDYLEHADWFIRSIHNKRGQSKVDVYSTTENVVFQCVHSDVLSTTLDEERMAEIDKILKANVKDAPKVVVVPKRTPRSQQPTRVNGNGYNYNGHGYGYGEDDFGMGFNTVESHETAMAEILENEQQLTEEETDPFFVREN